MLAGDGEGPGHGVVVKSSFTSGDSPFLFNPRARNIATVSERCDMAACAMINRRHANSVVDDLPHATSDSHETLHEKWRDLATFPHKSLLTSHSRISKWRGAYPIERSPVNRSRGCYRLGRRSPMIDRCRWQSTSGAVPQESRRIIVDQTLKFWYLEFSTLDKLLSRRLRPHQRQ